MNILNFVIGNFFLIVLFIILLTIGMFIVGERLAYCADKLVLATGISGAFVGFILIALITSVPEIIGTFVSASQGLYGLAAGGILGSNVANIAILTVLFLIFPASKNSIDFNSIFSLLSGLILLTIVAFLIFYYSVSGIPINKYIIVIVFLSFYLLIMVNSYQLTKSSSSQQNNITSAVSVKKVIFPFVFNSLMVIILAWGLVFFCDNLSLVPVPLYGKTLGQHFIGTLILAVATSVPELATTYQILRIGNSQMAVENIAGSNVLNIMVLVFSSLITRNNLWASIPFDSFYTIFAILLATMLLCISGIITKSRRFQVATYLMIVFVWIYSLVLII